MSENKKNEIVSFECTTKTYHGLKRALDLLGFDTNKLPTTPPTVPVFVNIDVSERHITEITATASSYFYVSLAGLMAVVNNNTTFHIGDKVICIVAHPVDGVVPHAVLEVGKEYTVMGVSSLDKILVEGEEYYHYAFHFVKVADSNTTVEALYSKIKELQDTVKSCHQQINDALLAEAKNKGFIQGAYVRCTDDKTPRLYKIVGLYVCTGENVHTSSFCVNNYWRKTERPFVVLELEYNGKVLTAPMAISVISKQPLVIHGYELSHNKGGTYVTFDRDSIGISLLKAVYANNNTSILCAVNQITLSSGKVLTAQDIDNILNYIGE